MDNEVFLDTAYVIALANAKDAYHQKAVRLAGQLRAEKTKLVTTRGVLLEIGNALSSYQDWRDLESAQVDQNQIAAIPLFWYNPGISSFIGQTPK